MRQQIDYREAQPQTNLQWNQKLSCILLHLLGFHDAKQTWAVSSNNHCIRSIKLSNINQWDQPVNDSTAIIEALKSIKRKQHINSVVWVKRFFDEWYIQT